MNLNFNLARHIPIKQHFKSDLILHQVSNQIQIMKKKKKKKMKIKMKVKCSIVTNLDFKS